MTNKKIMPNTQEIERLKNFKGIDLVKKMADTGGWMDENLQSSSDGSGEWRAPSDSVEDSIKGDVSVREVSVRAPSDSVEDSFVSDLKKADAATSGLGDMGVSIIFNSIKPLVRGDLLGKGEFFVITTVMDGSGQIILKTSPTFQGMDAGQLLPLGQGGLLAAFIQNPKWFIDIHMILMEEDQGVKDMGAAIDAALKDSNLSNAAKILGGLAGFAAPQVVSAFDAVTLFGSILASTLKQKGNDHIGSYHDFHLKQQNFGHGRHPPSPGTNMKIGNRMEIAYTIDTCFM